MQRQIIASEPGFCQIEFPEQPGYFRNCPERIIISDTYNYGTMGARYYQTNICQPRNKERQRDQNRKLRSANNTLE